PVKVPDVIWPSVEKEVALVACMSDARRRGMIQMRGERRFEGRRARDHALVVEVREKKLGVDEVKQARVGERLRAAKMVVAEGIKHPLVLLHEASDPGVGDGLAGGTGRPPGGGQEQVIGRDRNV